jgi:hypothetical protein
MPNKQNGTLKFQAGFGKTEKALPGRPLAGLT